MRGRAKSWHRNRFSKCMVAPFTCSRNQYAAICRRSVSRGNRCAAICWQIVSHGPCRDPMYRHRMERNEPRATTWSFIMKECVSPRILLNRSPHILLVTEGQRALTKGPKKTVANSRLKGPLILDYVLFSELWGGAYTLAVSRVRRTVNGHNICKMTGRTVYARREGSES